MATGFTSDLAVGSGTSGGPNSPIDARQASGGSASGNGHVNYVWRTLDEVKYPRFPPGDPVPVITKDGASNGASGSVELVDPQFLLRTRVLERPRKAYSHCTHYAKHSACDLGGQCGFVHCVTIDPGCTRRRRVRHRDMKVNPLQDGPSSRRQSEGGSSTRTPGDSDWESAGSSHGLHSPPGLSSGVHPTTDYTQADFDLASATVPAVKKIKHNPLEDCNELEAADDVARHRSSSSSSRSSRAGWYRNPYSEATPIVAVAMESSEPAAATSNHSTAHSARGQQQSR